MALEEFSSLTESSLVEKKIEQINFVDDERISVKSCAVPKRTLIGASVRTYSHVQSVPHNNMRVYTVQAV
jgi:hypothetical protein